MHWIATEPQRSQQGTPEEGKSCVWRLRFHDMSQSTVFLQARHYRVTLVLACTVSVYIHIHTRWGWMHRGQLDQREEEGFAFRFPPPNGSLARDIRRRQFPRSWIDRPERSSLVLGFFLPCYRVRGANQCATAADLCA